jgi:uncharacterized membrane protein
MTPLQLIGRLHPLVVHFPIALLVVAGAVEFVRVFRNINTLGIATIWALGLGALGAIAAVATGWLFASDYHPQPSLDWMLRLHRVLGIATAVLASISWFAARVWAEASSPRTRWARRGLIWLTTGLLIITAHFGALMVWGADYFSQS